jgi:ABC-type Fe3+ transport system, permease component
LQGEEYPGKDFLDSLVTIPIAVPGVILAVGYLLFFSSYASQSMLDPFINPGLLLIFTYTVRRIPFTTRSVFAGLQQTHESLEEASLNLGAGRGRTFVSIVIPLISQSVIGGSLLSFVYSMNEVSTSITLSSLRPEQGPITFYMSQVVYSSGAVGTVSIAAALAVLLMTIQLIVMTISTKILKQRVAFLGV